MGVPHWCDPRDGESGLDPMDVQKVVAIAASSRGGSSYLHAVLAASRTALSIGGEHTALYRLNGITRGADGSDRIAVETLAEKRIAGVVRDLLELVRIGEANIPEAPESYAELVGRRLALQWPLENWTTEAVHGAVDRVYRDGCSEASDIALFRQVLTHLARDFPAVAPVYYDGMAELPVGPEPVGPPSEHIIEEPPFVVPARRRRPSRAELREGVLVLKASVDAYRLPLLRRMFPHAEISVLHLTRNPAASINGLYDGWLDRGFYSYRVATGERLQIAGYSERADFATQWWNFDLPPTWRETLTSPLAEVCAHQWAGAHSHILNSIDSVADRKMTVRLEDLLSPGASHESWPRVFAFAGLVAPDVSSTPVVMATSTPNPGRWRRRAKILTDALETPLVHDVQRDLGYGRCDETWT